MRTKIGIALLVIVFSISVCAADPAPPFSETVADAGAFDLTCMLIDAPTNTYEWLLDYNGTSFPSPMDGEFMAAFVVYDDVADYVGAGATAEIWNSGTMAWDPLADWSPLVGMPPFVAIEWSDAVTAVGSRVQPPEQLRFTASFDDVIADCTLAAIHVQQLGENGERSEWVNNTPELPPSALLSLSMAPLGLAYIRGRRRKR